MEDNPNLKVPEGWVASVRGRIPLPEPAPPPFVSGDEWEYAHSEPREQMIAAKCNYRIAAPRVAEHHDS